MNYYVYANWRADNKAVIHVGDCGHCNEGKGQNRSKSRGTENGIWSNPFRSYEEAKRYALSLNMAKVLDCKLCAHKMVKRNHLI